MYDTLGQLRRFFDGSSQFLGGHQIVTVRRIRHKAPLWILNDTKIKEILLRSFPKMFTDPKQRFRAGRWFNVAYWYFRIGASRSEIAEAMGIKVKNVSDILQRVSRAAQGYSTDGKKRRLGSKVPGRPKTRRK